MRLSGNEEAHRLANEALSLSDEHVLLEEVPGISLILFLLSTVL